jgi:hypothetical protein
LNIQIAKGIVLKLDLQSIAEAFAAYVDLWSMLPFTSAISSIFAGIPGAQLCVLLETASHQGVERGSPFLAACRCWQLRN